MGNEITQINDNSTVGRIIEKDERLLVLCERLAKSGDMIPKHYQGNVEKVFAAVLLGAEVGLQPMQSLRSIYVVNGVPTLYGDSMLALVRASGQLEYIREYEDPEQAGTQVCELKRKGDRYPIVRKYGEAEADLNINSKNPIWKTHRKRMKQMRARTWALRDAFPDILMGLYSFEEADDIVSVYEPPELQAVSKEKSDAEIEIDALAQELNIPKGKLASMKKKYTEEELLVKLQQEAAPIQEIEVPKPKSNGKQRPKPTPPDFDPSTIYKEKTKEEKVRMRFAALTQTVGTEEDYRVYALLSESFGTEALEDIPVLELEKWLDKNEKTFIQQASNKSAKDDLFLNGGVA